jgi:hypothetical protein
MIEKSTLVGSWRHSHEEDTPQGNVYRRATYTFPPSRGRQAFELKADGTGTDSAIAPADGNLASKVVWDLTMDGTLVFSDRKGGPLGSMAVVAAAPDRLVVRRLGQE